MTQESWARGSREWRSACAAETSARAAATAMQSAQTIVERMGSALGGGLRGGDDLVHRREVARAAADVAVDESVGRRDDEDTAELGGVALNAGLAGAMGE